MIDCELGAVSAGIIDQIHRPVGIVLCSNRIDTPQDVLFSIIERCDDSDVLFCVLRKRVPFFVVAEPTTEYFMDPVIDI
jgi:hypothetical protein